MRPLSNCQSDFAPCEPAICYCNLMDNARRGTKVETLNDNTTKNIIAKAIEQIDEITRKNSEVLIESLRFMTLDELNQQSKSHSKGHWRDWMRRVLSYIML